MNAAGIERSNKPVEVDLNFTQLLVRIGDTASFGDGRRAVYLMHHEDGEAVDSYWPMRGEMTVFGFGHKGINKFMEQEPAYSTAGFCEGSDYADFIQTIKSAYIPLSITVGHPQIVDK